MYQTLTIKTGPPFTIFPTKVTEEQECIIIIIIITIIIIIIIIFPTKVTEEQECSPQVFLSAVQYLDRVLACLPIKR